MPAPELLWQPSSERIETATITRYLQWLERTREVQLDSYDALWHWSVAELEEFWRSLAEFFDVRFSRPPRAVLGSREMPGAEWFPGSTLNYADHILSGKDPTRLAPQHTSELRELGA